MTRPRRLYSTAQGKFYYLIDGKKKFVKVPAGKEKQMASINIKNIVNVPEAKRLKRRKKRVIPKYGKKVIPSMGLISAGTTPAELPVYFYKPKKEIKTIEDIVNNTDDTDDKKLTRLLLKDLEKKEASSKIKPSVAIESGTKGFTFTRQEFANLPEDQRKIAIAEGRIVSSPDGTPTGVSPSPQMPSGRLLTNNPLPIGLVRPSAFRPTGQESKEDTRVGESKTAEPEPQKRSLKEKVVSGLKQLVSGKNEAKVSPEGSGSGDGLYNDEIEKVIKKRIKNYVPVIASDEINELPRYVARGDKRFGFVINTNPSTSDGSGNDGYRTGHWRSVYINNEDDYPTVEYFDPLTEGKMPPELITMCRKIAMKMNPSMMFKYKQNMLRRQSKMTSNCGWHSVKFLDDRYNGVPWSEATGYDDYMSQHSSAPDDSHDGEKDISKYIKKYESYI
tara:strand:- start:571 stop:1908 length:1338 start_codon:yes stop_codon:yes gene_type:complete